MEKQVRVKDIAISETGFVFDPFSGGTFTLNATGQFVIKAVRDGLSRDQIVAKIRESFSHVTSQAAQDVDDFMRTLQSLGLLVDAD